MEKFIDSDRIEISPSSYRLPMNKRVLLILNMTRLVQHVLQAIRYENSLQLTPVFDTEKPIRSTGDMLPWYSGRACEDTKRSHINFCTFDSTWEAVEAFHIDKDEKNVSSWVKNDHLGFEILYIYRGGMRKYRPDFLIQLANETMLVLEVKGQDNEENKAKRSSLNEWVKAVNQHGGFGKWAWDVSLTPSDIFEKLEHHGS